jgi:hypothetical protein
LTGKMSSESQSTVIYKWYRDTDRSLVLEFEDEAATWIDLYMYHIIQYGANISLDDYLDVFINTFIDLSQDFEEILAEIY